MRKPIKEIEIEGDDKAYTIMQVAQRLPPQYHRQSLTKISSKYHCNSTKWIVILYNMLIQELSSASDYLLQASL